MIKDLEMLKFFIRMIVIWIMSRIVLFFILRYQLKDDNEKKVDLKKKKIKGRGYR